MLAVHSAAAAMGRMVRAVVVENHLACQPAILNRDLVDHVRFESILAAAGFHHQIDPSFHFPAASRVAMQRDRVAS